MAKEIIKEVIVVEGASDIAAVKAAVNAQMIAVGGFGVRRKNILQAIRFAQEKTGVIVLTDADNAGEQIRKTIEKHIPGVRHAYISRRDSRRKKDGKIGVEHASPDDIRQALSRAHFKQTEYEERFTFDDLLAFDLTGSPDAKMRREELGRLLQIGYANSKQFLNKLNHFQIERQDFIKAIEQLPHRGES